MKTRMTSAFNRYFQALNTIDRAAYLAAFSEDATLQDPFGGRVFQGQEGLNKWFSGFERTWASFTISPAEPFIAGDRAAVPWSAQATTETGKTATFAGVNVFTINDDGRLTSLEGYWGAAAMMAQIA